jgi:type VI secretion system protein
MRCSLFDALSGSFPDGRSLQQVPEEDWQVTSVLANLHRLLNSRRGSRKHLPALGLPDLGEVHRAAPESYEELRQAIKECVELYEPRLTRVRVTQDRTHAAPTELKFILTADLVSRERMQLETVFSMSYEASVRRKDRVS